MRELGVVNIGVTRYALPLGPTELKKMEHLGRLASLHVVGFSTSLRYQRASEPVEFYLLPFVPIAALRLVLLVVASTVLGLRLAYRGQVQLVLSQSPYEGLAGIFVRGVAWVMRRRVVVVTEVHGDWSESPFRYHRVPLSAVFRPILAAWAGFVLRRSDRIRTISRFLERRIAAVVPEVPLHRFPGYTDFELFDDATETSRSDTRVLSVGALYPVKGFDTLIRAMKQVTSKRPEATLHLAGDGPMKRALREHAAHLGVEASLRLLGSLSPTDLRKEYRSARLFVLPSLSEGLGRVVWEAMACGLPVVASDVGGIPELVENEQTGFLVPPGDEDAVAERILWLFEHPREAEAMGARGKQSAKNLYSTESYIEGYRALFQAS